MKPLLLILIFFLSGCAIKGKDPYELLVTQIGFVYVGMPKEDLPKAGYTDLMKKGYRKENNEEWIAYLNWANPDSDKVTFYIVDGKVKGWKEQ